MHDLRIDRLGLKGDGVAAGPVFVPGALPGETVAGEVQEGRIARPKIMSPSDQRVRPPCRHAGACGGCVLQHASDAFVADWKTDMVRQQLARAGIETVFRPIRTSPAASRRRATLAGRRLKAGPVVGFHARASDTVTPIPGCRLLHPALMAALPGLEDLTALGASRRGEIAFHVTLSQGGVDVLAEGGRTPDPHLAGALAEVARKADLARLSWNGEPIAARRPALVRMGRAEVPIPPGAFLQATGEGQAALTDAVSEVCRGAAAIADLFSGAGTFALPLAEAGAVDAFDGDADLLGALDAGWRGAQGLKPITTRTRDLFRNPLLSDELARFDVGVIDPPRAGAEAQIAQVAASRLERLAYVSCNPVTFARDAAVLVAAGFGLEWVQVVDQFRWSAHIELVAAFARKS